MSVLIFWTHSDLEAGSCKSPSSEVFPSLGQFFPVSLGLHRQMEAGCIPSLAADDTYV